MRQRLALAIAGKRQLVFVSGEPGIGKTALVDSFLKQQAIAGEVEIGRGQCIQHYGTAEAYLPLFEALARLCQTAERGRFLAILEQHAPSWLAQMPALLQPDQRQKLQAAVSANNRECMLRELAEALEVMTKQQTLILWFEDLQWSDHGTVEWLSFVARRREAARLMMIGTYRPVDVIIRADPLRAIKLELQLHGYCDDLSLSLLSTDAVAEYLEMRFSGRTRLPKQDLAQAIHQRTEGNPLFMSSVIDYAIARGVLVKDRHGWHLAEPIDHAVASVPANLRQLIEEALERLTPAELLDLEAASVAGQMFSAAAVAAALGTSVEAVEEECIGLTRRALFLHESEPVEWPDGTIAASFSFLHALYRQVLYERMPATKRGACIRPLQSVSN